MALGSYFLGAKVRIPINVTVDGTPLLGVTPVIERIILPSGSVESGFPKTMIQTHQNSSIYYLDYIPKFIGDYIVISKIIYSGKEYNTIENFTVNDSVLKVVSKTPPRSVAS